MIKIIISITVAFIITGIAVSLAIWPLRKQKIAWLLGPLFMIGVGSGCWYLGSWQDALRFMQREARQQDAEVLLRSLKSPDALIKRLEKQVEGHPNSAKGWYLLGRLYASQRFWEKSLAAFTKAYQLNATDELIAINYAQSLFIRQQHGDDELARKVLRAVLDRNPQQGDALMLLAMDAQRQHHTAEALKYWRRLLLLVPASSGDAERIRKTIHELTH
jgi:cytochrome c-type biogenesis protein CcmH